MDKWNPEMINRILRNRNYTGDLIQGIAKRINDKDILKGYLKCADCGKSIIIKKSKGHEYYYCSSYIRNGACTNHSVKKDELLENVLNIINKKINSNNSELTFQLIDKYINEIKLYEDRKTTIEFKD